MAVLVILGAEPSLGQALIATIITTVLLEAQRLLPVYGFRDALNFKQVFVTSLGRGGMKPRCLPCCKDEENWEKQEPSPWLPAVPTALPAMRTRRLWDHAMAGVGSLSPSTTVPGILLLLQRGGLHSSSPRSDSSFPIKAAPERGLL